MPLSKEYILTLLKTPKIGPVSVKAINQNADFKLTSIPELLELIVETKTINSKVAIPELQELFNAYDVAQRIVEKCERENIKIITSNDNDYPIKLLRLTDYPIITYVKGDVSAINSPLSVGVIGTREPSDFGARAGRRVAKILAKNGFSIISGLAVGCDTAGHVGALDVQGQTVAVLASGVDIIYPKENKILAERIVDNGGALFSEYELGFRPQKSTFVERDRIQSGLSNGLLVVETDIQGGTMHAVNAAKKMNMIIGCISNHPESLRDFPKIRGNKLLISEGAFPIGNTDQIFNFVKEMNPNAVELVVDEKNKDNNSHYYSNTTSSVSSEEKLLNLSQNTKEDSTQPPISNQTLMDSITELRDMLLKLTHEHEALKIEFQNIINKSTAKDKTATSKTKKRSKNLEDHPKLL